METQLEGMLVEKLKERYNIKKTTVYERLKALGITPIKEGRRSYVSGEQLAKLDQLHEYIEAGGVMPKASEPSSEHLAERNGHLTEQPEPTPNRLEIISASIILAAQELAGTLKPQVDPFANLEALERLSRFGWVVSSSQVRSLIGRKPRPRHIDPTGQRFDQWGDFQILKMPPEFKIGTEAGWKIKRLGG